jgi:hypothetical protein
MLLTTEQIKEFKRLVKAQKIHVVGFDLETSPSQFYGWGTGEQYVDVKTLVKGTETKVITAQYMNSLEKKPKYLEWHWSKEKGGDDRKVVEGIAEIVNKADIVIAQNGKSFDIRVLQERAKVLRCTPINVDFMIDTLTYSRSSFRSMSHRLDYRSKQYGLGGKHTMNMQDWIDIVEGRTKPQTKMVPYGLKDVVDMDKMFWLDLPYAQLPKSTVSKILKLIGSHNKLSCPECAAKRQSKFNCEKLNAKKFKCLNCSYKGIIA